MIFRRHIKLEVPDMLCNAKSRRYVLLVTPFADEFSETQLVARNNLASLLYPGLPTEPTTRSAVELHASATIGQIQAQLQLLQELVPTLSATQSSMHGLLQTISREIRRMFALLNRDLALTMSSLSLTHPRDFNCTVFYPVLFGMAL